MGAAPLDKYDFGLAAWKSIVRFRTCVKKKITPRKGAMEKRPARFEKRAGRGTSAVLFWVAAALGDEAHQKFKMLFP